MKKIKVEFINNSDQSVLGVVELNPDQLPDSFALDTTFDLMERKWSVVSATPVTKAEFLDTGHLRVVLSEISMLTAEDLKNILYSLPTISNDVALVSGDTFPHDGLFPIHEDDWRQIEFVAGGNATHIDEELEEIRRIYVEERSGIGFKTLHIRKRIPHPMRGVSVTVADLKSILPPVKTYEALSYHRTLGTVPLSFAWSTKAGVNVWGQTDEKNVVTFLCLSETPTSANLDDWCTALAVFTTRYNLYFVDWCWMIKLKGQSEEFKKYFRQKLERIADKANNGE